ncbi:hypothetical protein [Ornithinimicrobium cerasi]|uniref:hypothetical protein n=1 Tax=Ornithinimicrobium cerasi TaxID=2248773 RepID=UPI000EFEA7CF|nr:hypothetical protein [Ornithinimicrobium cerasi]
MSTSTGENRPTTSTSPDPTPGTTHRDTDRTTITEADRRIVQEREEEAYGGMKVGAGFFGWLTAVGTTVLLAALVAAAGSAIGFATDTTVEDAAADAGDNAQAVGIGSAVLLLLVLFVAYLAGGYVAGRMARFDGLKQGLAVWLWAILIAVVVTVLGLVAGDRFNVLSQLDALPAIPVSAEDATTTGILALLAVAVTTLVGAVLGGLTGMRFHRNVDRAGLGEHR